MRANVGTFAAALGFVAVVGAFHTPYRPEQSRHYDVTKTDSFHPITEKVRVAGWCLGRQCVVGLRACGCCPRRISSDLSTCSPCRRALLANN